MILIYSLHLLLSLLFQGLYPLPPISLAIWIVSRSDNQTPTISLEDVTKNPRIEITHKKYRKQIDWRRNETRDLLIRGYSQYEISNTLHLSTYYF